MRVVASWIAAHYQSLHAHTHPGGFDIGTFHHLRTGRRAHAHVGVQGPVDHGCGYHRRGHHHQILNRLLHYGNVNKRYNPNRAGLQLAP